MKQKESWCGMQGWDSLTRAGSAPEHWVSQGGTGAAPGPHHCWVLLFVGGMMPELMLIADWSGMMAGTHQRVNFWLRFLQGKSRNFSEYRLRLPILLSHLLQGTQQWKQIPGALVGLQLDFLPSSMLLGWSWWWENSMGCKDSHPQRSCKSQLPFLGCVFCALLLAGLL